MIELQPSDLRKVVSLGIEKKILEKFRGRLQGRRISGAKPPIDLQQGLLPGIDLIAHQRIPQGVAHRRVLDEEDIERFYVSISYLLEIFQ